MSKTSLKKLVRQLGAIKGRHTELVTVYVPAGANLHEIAAQLRNEESTAENIKSKGVRKNVTTALDKIIRHMHLYNKTPQKGMAIFCGNVSEREGSSDIELWVVEPPEEVKVKMYWCDQRFVLEPLEDMVKEKEIYGIICLDKSEGTIALLIGKRLETIFQKESIVPGKTRAGGQCFTGDTKVRCLDGDSIVNKPIKSVVKGDKVFCYDAKTMENRIGIVNNVFAKDTGGIFKITTDSEEINSTGEHVFFVSNKTYFKEKSASELAEGEFLVLDKDGILNESKIVSIRKENSTHHVFDLSVNKYHNLIANGLLVHNSSQRFSRVREGMLNDWLKQIGEAANKIFEEHREVIGIIVSGSGPIKEMFLKEDYMHADVKKKVIGVIDTSYTGPFGLEETVAKSDELLKEAGVTKEKKILQQFLTELQKPHGRVSYGIDDVVKKTEAGAVDRIIVSEASPLRAFEFVDPQTEEKKIIFAATKPNEPRLNLLGEKDIVDFLEDLAENYGSKVIAVSNDTREGQQFLELGGVGALLRYNV